jgi:hypothetical protein
MGNRGRPSSAALAISSPADALQTMQRLRPPHDLTDEEVEVWAHVVENEPADWFSPSTAPLLAQYCRHTVHARRVAELIERAGSDPELAVRDYDRLLKMQDREGRALANLATKMRIAQQSTTNHRGNKVQKAVKKPWEA